MLYSLGSQADVVVINHASHLYYKVNVVCRLRFNKFIDLNLTSRVFFGFSGFLPHQNQLIPVLAGPC